MTADIGLLIVVGILVSAGVYLLMDRSILRMLLGLMLASNGVNLLILIAGGAAGNPPIVGSDSTVHNKMADPLAQAMILTAIVISMGLAAFVLGLAYRAFTASNTDDSIEDDEEDIRLSTRTPAEDPAFDRSSDPRTGGATSAGDVYGPENAGER